MVTSRAVVGSSAMSSSGSQARAIAIITRWAMPPDISCGYDSEAALRVGDAHLAQQLQRPVASRRLASCPGGSRGPRRSGRPTVHDRVERALRLLEDHADPVAAELAHRLASGASAGPAVEDDLARLHPPGRCHQAQDRQAGDALAAARLADEAHDLAAVDVEVDAVDGADQSVARLERGGQAAPSRAAVRAGRANRSCRCGVSSSTVELADRVAVIGSVAGRARRAARHRAG